MRELTMKTATDDSNIGSQSACNPIIVFFLNVVQDEF